MKQFLLDLLCLIYYVTASIETIPSMWRIWKRKSSQDYSIPAACISVIGNISWTAYIYLSNQTVVVYIGTAFDALMAFIYVFLVFKYHNPEK